MVIVIITIVIVIVIVMAIAMVIIIVVAIVIQNPELRPMLGPLLPLQYLGSWPQGLEDRKSVIIQTNRSPKAKSDNSCVGPFPAVTRMVGDLVGARYTLPSSLVLKGRIPGRWYLPGPRLLGCSADLSPYRPIFSPITPHYWPTYYSPQASK